MNKIKITAIKPPKAAVRKAIDEIRNRAKSLPCYKDVTEPSEYRDKMESKKTREALAEIVLPNNGGTFIFEMYTFGYLCNLALAAAKLVQPTWYDDDRITGEAADLIGWQFERLLSK